MKTHVVTLEKPKNISIVEKTKIYLVGDKCDIDTYTEEYKNKIMILICSTISGIKTKKEIDVAYDVFVNDTNIKNL